MKQYLIAPSILSADFARLVNTAKALQLALMSCILKSMDNHDVPNLTIGRRCEILA
ncbi:hypothetical protein ACLB1N_27275 [Escherichia coli]